MHRRRRPRSRVPWLEWSLRIGTLAAALLVPLPETAPAEPELPDDPRRAISARPAQRQAVLYVMRENLRSVHLMLRAAHDRDLPAVRSHAVASASPRGEYRAEDAFPEDTPKLWSELGRSADQLLSSVGAQADVDRARVWTDLGSATAVCGECHRRYRLSSK